MLHNPRFQLSVVLRHIRERGWGDFYSLVFFFWSMSSTTIFVSVGVQQCFLFVPCTFTLSSVGDLASERGPPTVEGGPPTAARAAMQHVQPARPSGGAYEASAGNAECRDVRNRAHGSWRGPLQPSSRQRGALKLLAARG